jgi:hypothetical protein
MARARIRASLVVCASVGVSAILATRAAGQQTAPRSAGQPATSSTGSVNAAGVISGDVTVAHEGRPLSYATIIIEPGGHRRFADAGGAFYVGDLAPGPYHVRIRQIGFAPADTTVTVDAAHPIQRLRMTLRVIALRLPEVTIEGQPVTACTAPGIPDSTTNPLLAGLFAEVQKNVDRYRLLIDEYPFEFTREEWRVVRNDAGYEQTVKLDTVPYEVQQMESRPYTPGKVVVWTTGSNDDDREQLVPLPTFRYLGDSAFQRAHCFDYVGVDTTGGIPAIRVDFRPVASIHTPDLEGSVYLDATSYVVRRAVFRLTEPNRVIPPISELSVTTTFRQIVPLVPLFDEVRYNQPAYKTGAAGTLEVDRLLRFRFEHGAPGRQ